MCGVGEGDRLFSFPLRIWHHSMYENLLTYRITGINQSVEKDRLKGLVLELP